MSYELHEFYELRHRDFVNILIRKIRKIRVIRSSFVVIDDKFGQIRLHFTLSFNFKIINRFP
jgi:hypothetical protein